MPTVSTYCTVDDVVRRLGEGFVLNCLSTGGDPSLADPTVAAKLAAAVAEGARQVDEALAPEFQRLGTMGGLPLAQEADALHPDLREWALRVACYRVAADCGTEPRESIKADYEDALKRLSRVRGGERVRGLKYVGDAFLPELRIPGRPRLAVPRGG